MPTPANNQTPGLNLDQKVFAASVLSGLKNDPNDLAADYTTEYTAPIEGQKTSVVAIRVRPELELASMPTSRNGLLDRTDFTAGGVVEVKLDDDAYFKVGVDQLGVNPGQTETELGAAGSRAVIRKGNKNLLVHLIKDGSEVAFGATFSKTTKSLDVWGSLLDAVTTFAENDYATDGLILHIAPRVWGRLIADMESLRTSVNAQATAAALLGVAKVRVVNFPTTDIDEDETPLVRKALAIFSTPASAAQPRVQSGLRAAVEDFDDIVEGRIKLGTKVIDAGAVHVITDGAAA